MIAEKRKFFFSFLLFYFILFYFIFFYFLLFSFIFFYFLFFLTMYLEVSLPSDFVASSPRAAPVLGITCAQVCGGILGGRPTPVTLLPSCGHRFPVSIHMLHQRLCTAAGICHKVCTNCCQPEWRTIDSGRCS